MLKIIVTPAVNLCKTVPIRLTIPIGETSPLQPPIWLINFDDYVDFEGQGFVVPQWDAARTAITGRKSASCSHAEVFATRIESIHDGRELNR